MKKILIQYLYIFVIVTLMLCVFTMLNACEHKKVTVDETLPMCENEQISTEQNPCRKDNVNINTLSEALNKLGETGTLPK